MNVLRPLVAPFARAPRWLYLSVTALQVGYAIAFLMHIGPTAGAPAGDPAQILSASSTFLWTTIGMGYVATMVTINRLHDIGKSGWILALVVLPPALMTLAAKLIPLVPPPSGTSFVLGAVAIALKATAPIYSAVGWLWLFFQCALIAGERGTNRYGPGSKITSERR